MAKVEATRKIIKQMFPSIIKLGYCEAQFLLRILPVRFYTHGVNGWNADVYIYNDDTAIVTGYRPFGNIDPAYEIVNEYDKKAQKIWYGISTDDALKRKQAKALLDEFMSAYVG